MAAESLKGSGSFGEGNSHAAASKQPSQSTTTNNTDTSSATKLNAAANAEAREAQQGWTEEQQLSAGKGLGKEAGVGPTYATTGGSGSTGSSGGVPAAPTGGYAGSAEQARGPGELKPKGKNITESSDLEGKGAFPEVGTENDPARVKEHTIQARNALPGEDAGNPKDTSAVKGSHPYDALNSEQAA